ncbi:hypothetical protein EV356DRAFT_182756 [Viridothelium virens]|uniref:F-box domain-containing protein n=1 Tax=Viridothelium virens TaxID=1048519 RepID=A0A6A6H7U9_VIRVR|nr:hypothetical protein EV356DRAFT_182756 [Viridothelium virens]
MDIPSDILLLILEALFDGKPHNLLSPARVSRAWNMITEPLLYRTVDLTRDHVTRSNPNTQLTMLERLAGCKQPDQSHVLPYIWHLKFPRVGVEGDLDLVMPHITPGLKNIREITYSNRSGISSSALRTFFERYPSARVNLCFDVDGCDG